MNSQTSTSTVYLLGAGASHGCDVPKINIRPPLMKGFIGTAADVLGSQTAIPKTFRLALARYLGSEEATIFNRYETSSSRWRDANFESLSTFLDAMRKIKAQVHSSFYLDEALAEVEDSSFLEDVLAAVREDYGSFPPMAGIDIDRRRGSMNPIKQKVIFQGFLDLVHTHLLFLVNETLSELLDSAFCSLHDALASRLRPGDVVISLNYDLLIDRALERSQLLWNYSTGYGTTTDFGRYGLFRDVLVDYKHSPRPDVRLLKLHGSLNWWRVYRHPEAGVQQSEPQKSVDTKGRTRYSEVVKGATLGGTFADVVCSGQHYFRPSRTPWREMINDYDRLEGIILKPYVVLPTLDKDSVVVPKYKKELFHTTIDIIWSQALEALCNASKIVVVGYSLPLGDYWMDWMLRESAHLGKLRELIVVNPDESVAGRLRDIFLSAHVTAFEDLREFLS